MSRGLDLKRGLEGKAEKQSTKLLGGVGCLEKSMRKTGRKAMLRYSGIPVRQVAKERHGFSFSFHFEKGALDGLKGPGRWGIAGL